MNHWAAYDRWEQEQRLKPKCECGVCKTCRNRQRMRVWREQNRDEDRLRKRESYARNVPIERERANARYAENAEAICARQRARNATPDGRVVKQRANVTERESGKKAARDAVRSALRNGTIQRPDVCSCCGLPGRIQAHHHRGYAPEDHLDIIWLRSSCHAKVDRLCK